MFTSRVAAMTLEWACSSVVEHCVDIAGVASSILATPTIIPFPNQSLRCGAHAAAFLVVRCNSGEGTGNQGSISSIMASISLRATAQ